MWEVLPHVAKLQNTGCRNMLREDFLQQLRDIKFDLMLIDGWGLVPCRFIVPHVLGVPYVYQMSAHMEWQLRLPWLPSFTPAFIGIDLGWEVTDRMSFLERVGNLFMMYVDTFFFPMYPLIDNSLLDEYAPGLTWEDLIRKSELFLVTRDHMLEWPGMQFPNVITSPGITITQAKPLPADLEAIFSAAKLGVIVVSFGSSAGDFEPNIMEELFKGLGQMKQTVVMRYIGDLEEGKKKAPANLHLLSWMPQFDMLAHNNTVAFVTHCGNNGQYEGIYNGVPFLGLPIFAEQHHNAFRGVSHGFGLKINDISRMKAEDLSAALTELIENKKYREKVQHASAILKSDPMLPREKMAYWVDHVMQYGGAHLRPAAMDMSFASLFMLDVLAFLGVVAILCGYIVYLICRGCCCECGEGRCSCSCRRCRCSKCCRRADKSKRE